MWWRHVMQASAVPGYGYRYRRWVLDSLRYIDVQDLATGGDHIPELGDVYVDVALVSRAPQQAPGDRARRPRTPRPGTRSASSSTAARGWSWRSSGSPGRARAPCSPTPPAAAGRPVGRLGAAPGPQARSRPAGAARAGRVDRRQPGDLAAGCDPGGGRRRAGQGTRRLVGAPAGPRPVPDPARRPGRDRPGRRPPRGGRLGRAADRRLPGQPLRGHLQVLRPASARSPPRRTCCVVRPFTAEQVQLFLDRWYLAAERHATGASGRTAAARRAAAGPGVRRPAELPAPGEHPALHDLAVNPLLLTMIATAHRYRGALPGSRADLYGEICQVLLSRRMQAKDLPELAVLARQADAPGRARLPDDARPRSDLPAERVLEILGPQLGRYSSSVTGEAFLDDVARNGLLVEAPAGRYAFTHLTFQEYLAARHVSANPDLVKSLADNVSDPWWHETILLYAATADASPIVRACLDSGTIPALTLAFDCDEASTEIDPDLRQRLDRERQRAYEPDCSPEHRRLIAGVLAARLVRQTLTTAAGTRICARPGPGRPVLAVPRRHPGAPARQPARPRADQPATGIWGTEAQAFVTWLNSITATATGLEVTAPAPRRTPGRGHRQRAGPPAAGRGDERVDPAGPGTVGPARPAPPARADRRRDRRGSRRRRQEHRDAAADADRGGPRRRLRHHPRSRRRPRAERRPRPRHRRPRQVRGPDGRPHARARPRDRRSPTRTPST